MRSVYCYINNLSIDVSFGAIISSIFLYKLLGITPSPTSIIILGLTVWSIYTFDHLIDAKKENRNITTERHLFHLKYYSQLTKLVVFMLLLIGVLVFSLPAITVMFGTALGCIVLSYFLSLHLLNWKSIIHKELTIAVVYTLGVMVGPLSLVNASFEINLIVIIATFFIIVLLNLLIFSLFDFDADKQAKFPSLTQKLGVTKSGKIIKILSALAGGLILMVYVMGFPKESILLFTMFFILQILFWFKTSDLIINNYRFFGDGIFFIPLIYIL
jgi:hypothetical protein